MTEDFVAGPPFSAGPLANVLLHQIEGRWPGAAAIWSRTCSLDALRRLSAQDIADVIYTLYLLGWPRQPSRDGVSALCRRLEDFRSKAGLFGSGETQLDVHGTAYLLCALELLSQHHPGLLERVLHPRGWEAEELVEMNTSQPIWPARWSHHSWRVSHWIGGTCAIFAILEARAPQLYRANGWPPSMDVLDRAENLIDLSTGFLRCYGSGVGTAISHRLFDALYVLRHKPIHAEIGGVVHVHWVSYFLDRPIRGADPLFRPALKEIVRRAPFLEQAPYCLDFDLLQIVRVIHGQSGTLMSSILRRRLVAYIGSISSFFRSSMPKTYTLHKIPGALAALHECLLFLKSSNMDLRPFQEELFQPRDIMRKVPWI